MPASQDNTTIDADRGAAGSGVSHQHQRATRTSSRYNLLSALLAFLIWGGWAYFVNRHATGHGALISAVTQGTCSLVITLVIVRAVGAIYARLNGREHQRTLRQGLRLVLPSIVTIAVTGSLLALAHTLVGTAAVAKTIAAPLTVAFGFALYTTIHIDRQGKNNT